MDCYAVSLNHKRNLYRTLAYQQCTLVNKMTVLFNVNDLFWFVLFVTVLNSFKNAYNYILTSSFEISHSIRVTLFLGLHSAQPVHTLSFKHMMALVV
jgi:hypothetical protein